VSQFAPGSLVQARGREWVLPDSDPELLVVRPLGGGEDEIAGILTGIEQVSQAEFPPPQAQDAGNAVSAGLLPTALQVGPAVATARCAMTWCAGSPRTPGGICCWSPPPRTVARKKVSAT
jgi:hypothetical protein